jgi:hypothetical protein
LESLYQEVTTWWCSLVSPALFPEQLYASLLLQASWLPVGSLPGRTPRKAKGKKGLLIL